MRIIKTVLIIVLVALVASCSLVKTAYNKAPELTIWWLDEYFSFNQAQNLALKPALQNLHNWHRKTQLPIYISLLQNMQAKLANETINSDEICAQLDNVKQSVQTLQLESIPIIIEIAPQLSDKQLDRFKQKLAKRTEKWKNEWWQNTTQDQLEVRIEKATDFAEDIYGDLSKAQIVHLKQGIESANINPEISYNEILRRNTESLNVLKTLQKSTLNTPVDNLNEHYQLLKTSFSHLQNSPNLVYQSYADALTKHTCETFANLHISTTPTQKLHAKNWLQGYIDQITALQVR